MGQQLAASQLGDGERVGQVQLKENICAVVESLLRAVGDEVPDSCVGNVDGTKQVRRWMRRCTLYRPQEGVHVTLLRGSQRQGERKENQR